MRSVTKINKPNINSNIGERIKYLRCKALLSQTDLSNELGRKREEITMFETGARTIDINTLKDIAKIFNVSTDYLLGLTDFESASIDNVAIHNLIGLSDEAINNLIRLKKYHSGNILDTINFLLEQEKLFPDKCYEMIEKPGSYTNEQISKALEEYKEKNYKIIFSSISDYYNIKIKDNEKILIDRNSVKIENDIEKLYGSGFIKQIISCKDLANTHLLKVIEDKLINSKQEYLNKIKDNEEQ